MLLLLVEVVVVVKTEGKQELITLRRHVVK